MVCVTGRSGGGPGGAEPPPGIAGRKLSWTLEAQHVGVERGVVNHHISTKSFKSVVRPGHGPEVWWRRQASEGAEKDGRAGG
eukprot:COSAG02_NODE_12517_length_1533_cov_24.968619_1_plen_81_part_10